MFLAGLHDPCNSTSDCINVHNSDCYPRTDGSGSVCECIFGFAEDGFGQCYDTGGMST